MWAEGNPSILSVLKFDSEVQDPGRQKANGGGGKKGREGLKRLFFFFYSEKSKLTKYSVTSDQSKSICTRHAPTEAKRFVESNEFTRGSEILSLKGFDLNGLII